MVDVLVIGQGGREHAICSSLIKSKKVAKVYCAPGNAGTSKISTNVDINPLEFDKIANFLDQNEKIKLTVVAPDDPLALGLVDFLQERGHRAYGPNASAAIIESSKCFSKYLMNKYNIPTPQYAEFTDFETAKEYVEAIDNYPIVIKADGLALGKGVIIAEDLETAKKTLRDMLILKQFNKAGEKVIVEEFIKGVELSVLAFTDGRCVKLMPAVQDHKKAFDNDKGPNTGGMGTFTPSAHFTEEFSNSCLESIVMPTIRAMRAENRLFKGVLYFGLMITQNGVQVLEYNARFGDPETQVLLPLLETDLYEIFEATIDERLEEIDIKFSNKAAVCVVLASGGYPKEYEKLKQITFSDEIKDVTIFHAGVLIDNKKYYTNGGRVLNVVAIADTIEEARKTAYKNIKLIHFENMFYRKDIGIKG